MRMRLSRYGWLSREPSPVSRMMAEFAADFRDGVDINLGVGYVNEETIPRAWLLEAMEEVVRNPTRYRQAFNYSGPEGSPNLIRSLKDFLARTRLGQIDRATLERKRLIIGPCGATSLLAGLSELVPKGLVVTADPIYYIYSSLLERKGFEILAVPEDDQGVDVEALAHAVQQLGSRARAISFFYFVTVNNPTGTILSNARRKQLLDYVARLSSEQRRRIPLVFDLAYEWLVHDPTVEPPASVMPLDQWGIVYEIGTLSKIVAPALRIGYMLGPDDELMRAMIQHTSDAGFGAPLFAQEMASYLLDHYAEQQLERVRAGYREKAEAMAQGIRNQLGPFVESYRGGQAGFYFYLTFRDLETGARSAFFRYLARATGEPLIDGPAASPHPRVVYIPGEYCVHPRGQLAALGRRQLRLSYGFEPTPRLLRGLELMREAAEWALRVQTERRASAMPRVGG